MPCLVGCLALATPRFAIVLVVIFSDYLGRAYDSFVWPLLGFFFLPLTTLAYAWAMNTHGSLDGIHLIAVILAVLIDVGLIGGSSRARPRRRKGE